MPERAGLPPPTQVTAEDGELIGRLRRTLGLLEAALASISDALVICDRSGGVMWCNQAFEALVGRSRLFLLGHSINGVLPPDAEGRPLLENVQLDSRDAPGAGLRALLQHDPLRAVAIEWRPVLSEPERPMVFCIRDISADLASEAMRLEVNRIAAERQQLEQQALACAVTGLPNRRAFEERLALALGGLRERSGPLTLFFCDLNGFKQVNDQHGHAAGDALLVTVGQRLQACLRSSDLVARLGGDEFVVLSHGPGGAQEAVAMALRLLEEVGRPWSLDGRTLHPAMSVGIAITDDAALDGAELLRRADLAMYDAKAGALLPVALHDLALEVRSRSRQRLGHRLQRALAHEDPRQQGLGLQYRPIVELGSGRIRGHEACMRLQLPEEQECPAADLLAAAEPMDLVGPLGLWMRATALSQLRRLQGAGDAGLIAFQLHAAELVQPGLSLDLAAQARRYGVDPGRIAVAVAEELLRDPPAALRQELDALHGLGVKVVLEGFGSGSTPLPALARLPLMAIRLHSDFSRGAEGEGRLGRLRAATIRLALDLDLEVIAAGIETEAELEELRALGCRWGQGPLFGPPLS